MRKNKTFALTTIILILSIYISKAQEYWPLLLNTEPSHEGTVMHTFNLNCIHNSNIYGISFPEKLEIKKDSPILNFSYTSSLVNKNSKNPSLIFQTDFSIPTGMADLELSGQFDSILNNKVLTLYKYKLMGIDKVKINPKITLLQALGNSDSFFFSATGGFSINNLKSLKIRTENPLDTLEGRLWQTEFHVGIGLSGNWKIADWLHPMIGINYSYHHLYHGLSNGQAAYFKTNIQGDPEAPSSFGYRRFEGYFGTLLKTSKCDKFALILTLKFGESRYINVFENLGHINWSVNGKIVIRL